MSYLLRLKIIFWFFLIVITLSDSLAVRKIRRTPIDFRYTEDLEASATAQKGDDKHYEEGGGTKYEETDHVSEDKKVDKGYEVLREFDKGEKGHHEKEREMRTYDEENGQEKKKHEKSGHFDEHQHGEEAEKSAKFGEEGKHQKGYSTKGEHSIFKKDEYEKKHDFYDEYHEDGEHEKHGGYHHEHEDKKGGHQKMGHLDSDHHENRHGKKKKHEEGHHYHDDKGHKSAHEHNSHHRHQEKSGKKGGQGSGRKWVKSDNR